eukprot:TRINITY_DN3361_c0_g1_i3.p1 TRINITY_DN3361_c0_g1~~TRINITY_DN3361_c0_g1_i3.p1  ORF type:complete len:175 (-),score=31.38 TRINITY_DN3361_c0_g1_i3:70-594(-)
MLVLHRGCQPQEQVILCDGAHKPLKDHIPGSKDITKHCLIARFSNGRAEGAQEADLNGKSSKEATPRTPRGAVDARLIVCKQGCRRRHCKACAASEEAHFREEALVKEQKKKQEREAEIAVLTASSQKLEAELAKVSRQVGRLRKDCKSILKYQDHTLRTVRAQCESRRSPSPI